MSSPTIKPGRFSLSSVSSVELDITDSKHGGLGSDHAHYGTIYDEHMGRLTAEEMDERRQQQVAYEYLCHLEEAKLWLEAVLSEELPPTTLLEEGLMNGVYLAKLGHSFAPEAVPLRKVYDRDQTRYKAQGLHFRHTDNINFWVRAMEKIEFPKIFYPETTDVYDRKNMPRTVYCLHALSLYLFKLGLAPQIQNLLGKVEFTEEEINNMRKALEKYGIQMPVFSKIGGILANEMSVDEAALHAAVIAINEAIEKQDAEVTLEALRNPAAYLNSLVDKYADSYQKILYAAKKKKVQDSLNRSMDPDTTYEPDVYDELLTQAEIQGFLNKTNVEEAIIELNAALDSRDEEALVLALQNCHLGMQGICQDNASWYMERLLEIRDFKNNNNEDSKNLERDDIQTAVSEANTAASVFKQRLTAVGAINSALAGDDSAVTLQALKDASSLLPPIVDEGEKLYHSEFKTIRTDKQDDLDFDEIAGGIKVLSVVAKMNIAIDTCCAETLFEALSDKSAHLIELEEENMSKYLDKMLYAKGRKKNSSCDLLTHFEIQDLIQEVNKQVKEELARVAAIHHINEAIDSGDEQVVLAALQLPAAALREVHTDNAYHYASLLRAAKHAKTEGVDDEGLHELWLEEIQEIILAANRQATDIEKLCSAITAINKAVDKEDEKELLEAVQQSGSNFHSVVSDCAGTYLQSLKTAKQEKCGSDDDDNGSTKNTWLTMKTKEGHPFYLDVETGLWQWKVPDDFDANTRHLTKDEIQDVISDVTAAHDRELFYKSNEPYVVKIQAQVRGHQARTRYKERYDFMKRQLPAIVRIQAQWKSYTQRKKYQERMEQLHGHPYEVVKIQAIVRMWLAKKGYQDKLAYFKDHEGAAILLQAWWRSNLARNDYWLFVHSPNPPLNVVRKFVHLLEYSDSDYSEELELTKLKEKVVAVIRSNQKLEQDLNTMDIKIGLLVKNRITLQDVVAHGKKLKNHKDVNKEGTISTSKGIKSLSKESRELLEAYQHLFYYLQTNPHYLAKLIFAMPQSRTTKFMESVILTLYNYAGNQREEYLLNKLFQAALEEEIRMRVEKPSDIVTGNPMVIRMVVGFNRNGRGLNSLRELLNPLVTKIISDKNLNINTNPVEVYKQWVNQKETESGQASGMPYDVTIDQALKHEEVREQIETSIKALKHATKEFFNAILQALDKIPYGIRYIAKVLRNTLQERFPEATAKEVIKIVGNLLYYRYINSAIVAPDAFDIIDAVGAKALTNEQRRNLGSVAKILQFAASNKGFGGDSSHLACLNGFIKDCHEKFKDYFQNACNVEEPEQHFNVDQWSELTMLTKPSIYISLLEIHDTHQLLLEHQDVVAPDKNDSLHELLADLGEPDLDTLIGEQSHDMENLSKSQLANTEISLTLTNKFEVPEEDENDKKAIYLRTKRMIVDLIRVQPGENLAKVLDTAATDQQEEAHQALIKKRDLQIQKNKASSRKLARSHSVLQESRLPLDKMKGRILENLDILVKAEFISADNNYQAIINDIAQDIRNQRRYRQRRKQEMMRVRSTFDQLSRKTQFYEQQIDYYNQYVKSCLDGLKTKAGKKANRRSFFGNKDTSGPKLVTEKYTAAKLAEKGVVLQIEDLPKNQFKNVQFEISSTIEPGVFQVSAKFMGVDMESVELVFQDLLQLQYEGVAVMKMFGRAKVNVNLLIFLLNSKFYGRGLETRKK